MSARLIRQALMAMLFVAAGALFLTNFLDNRSGRSEVDVAPPPPPPPKFSVIQAMKPLVQGSIIHRDDVEVVSTSILPGRGTITSVADAVNRIASRNIARSEPLSDGNTTQPQGGGLSELIPPGLRAIALRVTDESAVANLIRPGDRVDVLLLSNLSRTQLGNRLFPPAEAATILQNVLVLAVGGATVSGGSANASHNVTLAVTPRQAAMVALVRTVGGEYLSLRANGDDVDAATRPVLTDDLQVEKPPEPRAASPPPQRQSQRVVEVISGKSDNISQVRVEDAK